MADRSERTTLTGASTNAANRRLKQAHIDEWNEFMSEETAQRGVEWAPRSSAEQKAAKQLEKLLDKYPHLAESVNSPAA